MMGAKILPPPDLNKPARINESTEEEELPDIEPPKRDLPEEVATVSQELPNTKGKSKVKGKGKCPVPKPTQEDLGKGKEGKVEEEEEADKGEVVHSSSSEEEQDTERDAFLSEEPAPETEPVPTEKVVSNFI